METVESNPEKNQSNRATIVATVSSTAEDYIVGKHVYGNLYGVDKNLLWDRKFLEEIVLEAIKLANMNLVEMKSWAFEGYHGGVSVIALILESHVAIHTWPDYGYATVDVYTCGEKSDPWKAFNYIVSKLKPRIYRVHYADRSSILSSTEQ